LEEPGAAPRVHSTDPPDSAAAFLRWFELQRRKVGASGGLYHQLLVFQGRGDSLLWYSKHLDETTFNYLHHTQKKGVRPSPHALF
jgi:hypothetical protein